VSESLELQKISQVWKAGRLLLGLTQKELAKALGLSQGSISKFESKQLEPSASDWYKFCQFAGFDAHKTLELGYIDGRKKFKHLLYSKSGFPLPLKYRSDFSLKIRELIPFKRMFYHFLGESFWLDFLKRSGLVPEMFYVYDFQISFRFLTDLLAATEKNGLDLRKKISDHSLNKEIHSKLFDDLSKKKNPIDLVKFLVDNQPYYQRVVDMVCHSQEGSLVCNIFPREEMKEIFSSEEIYSFILFKINTFQALISESNTDVSLSIVEESGPAVKFRVA